MSLTLSQASITFVGAGSMAEAIVRGLVSVQPDSASNVHVLNRSNTEKLVKLHELYGVQYVTTSTEKHEAIRKADIVVLAFKPKDAVQGLEEIKSAIRKEQLLVSVIAGLSMSTIEAILGVSGQPIARTMPNTSSTIGLGATGISFSAAVSDNQRELALEMFASTGIVSEVEESKLDIVTGVSGSGPAYIYYMMEAMIAGGIQGGLPPEEARRLTVQTVLGAAQMVETTGEDPGELRRKVTSPNGTTQAALEKLAAYDFQTAVSAAVLRASERAAEIGAALSDSVISQSK
jgi:pyrroline-5-carboxylate reductase